MKPGHYRSFSENGILHANNSLLPEVSSIQGMRSDYVAIQASNSVFFSLGPQKGNPKLRDSNDLKRLNTKTIVVVPSIDLDGKELRRMCNDIEIYEERQLYHLLLLKDPSFRIIYLSSNQIDNEIVRYYLSLDDENAKDLANRLSRLYLLRPKNMSCDPFCKSLSKKTLEDEKILQTIKHIICQISTGEAPCAGLSLFCGSLHADHLARKLDLRLLEAKSDDLYFGCKQGR